MDKQSVTAELKSTASRLGFQLAGVCPANTPPRYALFREWIERGYAGEMQFLSSRVGAYEHPGNVLDGARSILMLGLNYRTADRGPVQPGRGHVARYAWGRADYHDVVHTRLRELINRLLEMVPQAKARGVVDTAPLLERDYARLAGLGWFGKNTLLLNTQLGSWFFLGAVVTDQELEYDAPHDADYCGTCRACLDACPTEAFPQPYVLDATRCISYLTIELRSAISHQLRPRLGDWLFGCDVCQEVCPWNRRCPPCGEASFEPFQGRNPLELPGLFQLTEAAFREHFRHTPLWRAKRRGLLRNAAIVLGNQRAEQAIPALVRGLHDTEPLVREACAWALGRFEHESARQALVRALRDEADETVRAEIESALEGHVPG